MFFIYLYQRWIYKIDPKRVNEFGVSGEDLANGTAIEDKDEQKEAQNGTVSPPPDKKND